jgi:virginiamycin B lyase
MSSPKGLLSVAVGVAIASALVPLHASAAVNGYLAFTEYPTASSPYDIVTGPDSKLWWTDYGDHIVQADPTTGMALNTYLSTGCRSAGIAVGSDQNLWVACSLSDQLLRVTTGGTITPYPLKARVGGDAPQFMTTAKDGNLWFTESAAGYIGNINVSTGSITEYAVPTAGAAPMAITLSEGGDAWFTEPNANKIGQVHTLGIYLGTMTEYPVPTANSRPFGITQGPDGSVYFTETNGNNIGRLTVCSICPPADTGHIDEFPIPTASSGPQMITIGPDANFWFTEFQANKIGSMNFATRSFTESSVPTIGSNPLGVATGPDGNLWFAEQHGNSIAKLGTRHNALTLDKTAIGFGNVLFGTTTAPQRVTLTNNGPDPANFASAVITGGSPSFSIVANTCNVAVASGSSCYVDVTWTPSTTYYQSLGNIEFKTWSGATGRPDQQTLNVGLAGKGVYVTCGWAAIKADLTSPQIVGSVVTFSATSSGCTHPNPLFRFDLGGPLSGAGCSLPVGSYSTSATLVWNTAGCKPGVYVIGVRVRDTSSTSTSGYDVAAQMTFALFFPQCSSSNIAGDVASPQAVATIVTFTATSVGCTSPLYQWWVRDLAGTWSIAAGHDFAHSSVTFAWNTATLAAGTYQIGVWAKQAGSAASYDAFSIVSYTLGVASCRAVSLGTSSTSPQATGGSITLTPTTSGCSNPAYRFWVRDSAGAWHVVQDYGVGATYTWNSGSTPVNTTSAGTFLLGVWARQPGSTNSYDAFAFITFSLTSGATCTVNIAADKASPQTQGASATWTATANGCLKTPLAYQFWVNAPGGTWAIVQPYGAGNTYVWTGAVAGTYQVGVWIKQAGSTAAYDNFALTTFTLTPTSSPQVCSSVNVSAAPASPSKAGTTVVFTVSATTGCSSPRYRWWVLDPYGNWQIEQDYATIPGSSFTWYTTNWGRATVEIGVWALQAGSSASYEAYSLFTYTLTAADVCSSVNITPNMTSPQTPGTTITFTATAFDCSAPEFQFSAAGQALQAYGSANSFIWSTTGLGPSTYTIEVWVRQAGSGAIPYEAFGQTTFTLQLLGTPCTTLALWPSSGTVNTIASQPPQPQGTRIVWQINSGGCSNVEYKFVLQPTWPVYPNIVDTPWGPGTSLVLNTATLPIGIYFLWAYAQQAGWAACVACAHLGDVVAVATFEVI